MEGLEVAIAQMRAWLQRDVYIWLDPESGDTNVAIAVKANRTRSTITLDKYEWDHASGQAQSSQHIEIRESDTVDESGVSGASLNIPFGPLFL